MHNTENLNLQKPFASYYSYFKKTPGVFYYFKWTTAKKIFRCTFLLKSWCFKNQHNTGDIINIFWSNTLLFKSFGRKIAITWNRDRRPHSVLTYKMFTVSLGWYLLNSSYTSIETIKEMKSKPHIISVVQTQTRAFTAAKRLTYWKMEKKIINRQWCNGLQKESKIFQCLIQLDGSKSSSSKFYQDPSSDKDRLERKSNAK